MARNVRRCMRLSFETRPSGAPQDEDLACCYSLPRLQPLHQLRRRIAVRRQAKLHLLRLYRSARLQSEKTVDLSDVVAAAREQRLQFADLRRRERHDLFAAA